MAQQLLRHKAFLRFGKIKKGPESALVAARHNLRELPLTPNIVQGKQCLNKVMVGPSSSAAVQSQYEAMLGKHGVAKLRKDAVRLIEALVSLPVGVDDPQHQYFEAALQWLSKEFGQANILSAVIHKDEAAQHMHVLIIPLIDGRMRGSDLMGGPGILRDRHARFDSSMQQPWGQLGIAMQEPLRVRKTAMAQEVLAYLKHTDDAMWKSSVTQVIRDCIEGNPEPFYLTLGLAQRGAACSVRPKRCQRATKQRTMAQIFTSPIKGMRGAKAERYRQSDEYLRAHLVAPSRKLSVPITNDAPKLRCSAGRLQAKESALEVCHLPGLVKRPMPSKPSRTLCSVGFAVARIRTRTSLAALVLQRNGGIKERGRSLRDTRQAIRQFAKDFFALALHAKLMHWWLLKSRGS